MRRDIEFKSKGITCRGWLYLPDEGKRPFPIVVMAGGWCYVKEIVMPHYADLFVKNGLAALLFDYRNLGASDGSPRQHLNPQDQIEDYRNAISFIQTLPDIDPERVGVWGISYSGGHVLILGAIDPRVKCVVSTVPVVDGYTNLRRVHGTMGFRRLLNVIEEDRKKRFEKEENFGYIAQSVPDPETTPCTWPFPESYEAFKQIQNSEAPRHEHRSTIESTELLMSYNVFPFLRRILNVPVLMLVADGDDHTAWDLEIEAYHQIPSPTKRLFIIPQTSHITLYNTRSKLEFAAKNATEWLAEHLIKAYE